MISMELEHRMLCNLLPTGNGRTSYKVNVLVSICLCLVIFLHHPHTVESSLEAYGPVEFMSDAADSEFSNFAVDERTGSIYIGAKNSLYHLHSDFMLQEAVSTRPDPAECGQAQPCDNYNRILAVAPPSIGKLINCESFSRQCQYRDLANISDPTDYQRIVINSRTPAVAILSDNSMYVGVSTEFDPEPADSPPYITKLDLEDLSMQRQLQGQGDTAQQLHFQLNFVNGFGFEGYTYFVTNQQQLIDRQPPQDFQYVSKINRVCQTSEQNFDSFTEVRMICSLGNGRNYNLIQAMEVSTPGKYLEESFNSNGDALLYAIFAEADGSSDEGTDPGQSVMCMYKMSDVQAKFIAAVGDCIIRGRSDISQYGINHLNSRCNSNAKINPEDYQCNALLYKYANGTDPVQAEAVISLDGVLATSIRTVIEENNTIALIGTSAGNLLKVHISNSSHARMYEDVKVGDTPVQQDTYFNTTDDQLYLLTEQKLVRLSVANCSQYTTCEACIGESGGQDGDPYCGWCSLEARCTRYQECDKKEVSTRWLPYDSEQCISISNTSVGFSVPISTPSQQIVISVSQLPPLSTRSGYECRFDQYTSKVTSMEGNQITCQTPPQDITPDIAPGQSAVTVALSIYSNETRVAFVKTDFNFYDCSLISSCTACMTSTWACDWCTYDNKCTYDQTTCQPDDIIISSDDPNGVEQCPYIITPDPGLLLSVGIETGFELMARNLPMHSTKVKDYECVLEYEGKLQPTRATVASPTQVTCENRMYTYNTALPEIEVSLSVRWNGSNIVDDDGITVTLYNCSVDRDSCSRCLSPQFTPAELACQWCGSTCAVMNSNLCSAQGVTPILQNSGVACAGPRITDISPTSGPIEGNTVVTITGTDIGQLFADLTEVRLGESPCNFDEMEDSYDPGRSLSCRTSVGEVGLVSAMVVVNQNGDPVEGSGGPKFNYENPVITSIFPTEGLEAGGTQLTITGTSLNTGSSVRAMVGDSPCIFNSPPTSTLGVCTTSASQPDIRVYLTMVFDEAIRKSPQLFTFLPNPRIDELSTLKTIKAGGSLIEVRGSGFDVIQSTIMKATIHANDQVYTTQESCMKKDDTTISCTSPALPAAVFTYDVGNGERKKRATETDVLASAELSFILDGYNFTYGEELQYFPNPVYERFPEVDNVHKYEEDIIINGQNLDLASTKADVEVIVGNQNGTVRSLAKELLIFSPPKVKPGLGTQDNSSKGMPLVVVKHGHLVTTIGWIDYSAVEDSQMLMIIILSGIGCLILIIVFILVMCYVSSQKRYKGKLKEVQLEMEQLEDVVKNEATKAFFDIQQDMSGIKDQLRDLGGMPFVTGQDYIRNMLFVGLDVQPMMTDPQRPEENLTRAMTDFSKLLNNKDFLIVFIRSLDEDRNLAMRDRNNIASLLTVCMVLEGKLSYLSDVMLTLMSEQITNAADVDRYRQLFRNVESIVEKILANWMALCMHKYVQKHVAYPLYMLYQAIKFQIEKGPIDVITGHAHFSLNYEYLLDEDVPFTEVGLEVESQVAKDETKTVKVLDVDTITQVKEKVLDAVFMNKPQSERKNANEVDLVLRSGKLGQLVLRDTDNTTEKPDVPRWAKVNTIQHYRIPDGAIVGLVYKQDNPNASLATPLDEETELLAPSPAASPKRFPIALQRFNTNVESDLEEGFQFYHISNLYEDDATKKTMGRRGKSSSSSTRIKHRKIREIYLRRLVSTKKSIQTFVDEALRVMLAVSDDKPLPKALKYLFDFLDRQADRHKLKADTSELWKNSCLPLRFWATVLTHPSYVFDMNQTRTVDACVSVLTQMLDNACKGIVPKYNFETSPSRVLYASELPDYIDMIPQFYNKIKDQHRVRQEEVDEEFADVCQTFQGTFSKIGTLHQLYEYASRRNDTLIDALEDDEQCQRASLAYKLEQIGQILAQGED